MWCKKNSPDLESVCSHRDLTDIDTGTDDTLAKVNAWKARRDTERAKKTAEKKPNKKRTGVKTENSKALPDKRIKANHVQNLDQIRSIVKEELAAMAVQLKESQESALTKTVEKFAAALEKIEQARAAERTQYIEVIARIAAPKSS